MKALLKKDLYLLKTGMKSLLFLIVLFSFIPSGFQNTFAVLYAAMLPYSALAYDERSHWDQMALCMPYSTRDIVRSKYVLGWLISGSSFLISIAAQLILRAFVKSPTPISLLFLSFCGACIISAVTLPFMFRFGVEKGRLTMILLIALICGGAGAMSAAASMAVIIGRQQIPVPLMLAAPAAAVIANLISMPLAEKWYERRK